jgi:outer membrane immunogenic protein
MRRFTSMLMATSSLMVFAAEVRAADLPRAMPAKAPVAALVRTTWTGCYLGGNIGYGRARNAYSPDPTAVFLPAEAPDQTINGAVGGGQAGCDYQFDPFVIGIQGMFDGTGMSGTGDPYTSGKTLKTNVPWFATLTGRVGYAFQPNLLLYVKGGAAWARTDFDFRVVGAPNGNGDVTRSGWTFGGGLEWMFAPSWSLFLEYSHLNFANRLETFGNVPGIGSINMNFKQNIDLVQLGVNYRVNWWR